MHGRDIRHLRDWYERTRGPLNDIPAEEGIELPIVGDGDVPDDDDHDDDDDGDSLNFDEERRRRRQRT